MGVTIHTEFDQGSGAWLEARMGLLTASEIGRILTPGLLPARNDKARAHIYEIAAQRIGQHVEPTFEGDAILRGREDEMSARMAYEAHIAPVREVGFITNDKWGFTLGYSPDGLVGDDGLIECKSQRQGLYMRSVADHTDPVTCPPQFAAQVQAGMLIADRAWCDLIVYCAGLPMTVLRIHPDEAAQNAILDAAADFELSVQTKMRAFRAAVADPAIPTIPTERPEYEDML